jgi:predicted tellurium resistance membrane protein TerC
MLGLALLTHTFLEIILGIDNIVFLSIVFSKLDPKDQPKAEELVLLLAMALELCYYSE